MIRESTAEFIAAMERGVRAGAETPLRMPDALEPESKRQRRGRRAAGLLGLVLLFFSGYFLTYHLFFKDISLAKLGKTEG